MCGETSATKGYNKLYFRNLMPSSPTNVVTDIFEKTVCVKECPTIATASKVECVY